MMESEILLRYRSELDRLGRNDAEASRRFNLLAAARGGSFLAAIALLWLGAIRGSPPLQWALLPLAAYVGFMIVHEIVVRRRDRIRRAVAWYERGVARLEDRWAGGGNGGEPFRSDDHLFADDLDLFGPGSLFELLCTAETSAGRETLADWIKAPALPGEVTRRQQAIAELRSREGLRLDVAVIGSQVGKGMERDVLARWGTAQPLDLPAWAAPAALGIALGNVVALAGAIWYGWSPWVPTGTILAGVVLAGLLRERVRGIVAAVERPLRDLDHMASLIARLEQESWTAPLLAEIAGRLRGSHQPASGALAGLDRRVGLLDSRRNQLFAPFGALLLWTTQLALSIERWRRRHGVRVGQWVTALGELEALASLATYSAEHPGDAEPELAEGSEAVLEAEALVHPLLPRGRAVPNDLTLGGGRPRALVVSGSNMSGKSTLLRAVGVNVVLAQAGAPVSARRFRLSSLRIGASFRPQDSLQQGQSRFYAEIGRLRRTVDLLQGERPVLFLLDELLSGTNSYDRALGARAIVEHLVRRGAIGLVTTHDLALAEIAEALAPDMANVHFEDTLEDGTLRFDYRLRPGVVRRSNAVELMRAVGLPV
ncbi:MAG TPA: hypothetical protein VGA78_11890 [Gemmatimonadales bacterium]